jgi:hypothetical protein
MFRWGKRRDWGTKQGMPTGAGGTAQRTVKEPGWRQQHRVVPPHTMCDAPCQVGEVQMRVVVTEGRGAMELECPRICGHVCGAARERARLQCVHVLQHFGQRISCWVPHFCQSLPHRCTDRCLAIKAACSGSHQCILPLWIWGELDWWGKVTSAVAHPFARRSQTMSVD